MLAGIIKAFPWGFIHAIKRGKAALPDDVAAVIEAARITERHGDEDNGPRIAVALGGPLRGMFIYSHEEAESRIRARWPWLNDAQLKRAVSYLDARVRLAAQPNKPSKRKSWIFDY
jgi:hypothetical protein